MIILTKKESVKKQVKFKDPHKTANEFIDLIAPTFGLKGGIK